MIQVSIDKISRTQWDQNAAEFRDYSVYQTWVYQQYRAHSSNQQLSRFVVSDGQDRVVSIGHIRIKKLKVLSLRVGYIQRGPLLLRSNSTDIGKILTAIKQAYVGSRVDILRVVPNFHCQAQTLLQAFIQSGFVHSTIHKPYQTIFLRVDDSEHNIFSRMHRGFRRYVKKAENEGFKVEYGYKAEYFGYLENLYDQLLKRKNFKGVRPIEFEASHKSLLSNEKLKYVVLFLENEPVGILMFSTLGKIAVGLLGACNNIALQRSGFYLLYWEVAKAAHREGLKYFDLGGIDIKNNASVYEFKKRLGGQEVSYLGAFDAFSNNLVKSAWPLLEKAAQLIK